MKVIYETARRALMDADGDWARAKALFREWLDSDARLRQQLTELLIYSAIDDAIEDCGRSERKALWAPSVPSPALVAGIRAQAERNYRDLMEYRLRNGKPLGDCTKAELLVEEQFYLNMGRTCMQKGRWFGLIAGLLKKSDSIVRRELRTADLERVQRCAKGVPDAA